MTDTRNTNRNAVQTEQSRRSIHSTFSFLLAFSLFVSFSNSTFAQPPAVPPTQQCVVVFAAGSPSSTTTGKIDVSCNYNMNAGWTLDYITIRYYKWNNNANNHLAPNAGTIAATHTLYPPAVPNPNDFVDNLTGLTPGDKYTVTVELFVKNGKLKAGDAKSAPANPNFIIVSN